MVVGIEEERSAEERSSGKWKNNIAKTKSKIHVLEHCWKGSLLDLLGIELLAEL